MKQFQEEVQEMSEIKPENNEIEPSGDEGVESNEPRLKKVKKEDVLVAEVEEQIIQIPHSIIHITWTPAQKEQARKLLLEKSVISVYHHFDQRIPYYTLRDWKKSKRIVRKKGSGRKPTNLSLDRQLLDWFVDARVLRFPVTNKLLVKKAMSLRDDLVEDEDDLDKKKKLKDLMFGKNWVKKFKKRHKIESRIVNTVCKKPYSYLENKLSSFYQTFDLIKDKSRLLLNMDETAVYLELTHKQTLTVKGENHVGIISDGKEKQKITVMLTIGYSPWRSHYVVTKIPPVIIFKKAKPRKSARERPESDVVEDLELKRIAEESGALFLQNYSGWNEEYMMVNYYIPHLSKHIPKQTNGLLLLDNFSAHCTEKVMETFDQNKIKYHHLPPNCTPIIQPLDVGVNAVFKRLIKEKYLAWIIQNFDDVVYRKVNSDQKFYKAASKSQVVRWVLEAWADIKDETIDTSLKLLFFFVNID